MYIFAAKLPHFVELTKEKAEYLQFSTFYFYYKNLKPIMKRYLQ